MRYFVIVALLAIFIRVGPVNAQFTTFTQGVYEFESYVPNMVYNGSWGTTAVYSSTTRASSVAASWVQIQATGKTFVLWRFMRQTGNPSSMNVCLGIPTVCTLVSNTSSHTDGYFDSYVVNLAAGLNFITIEWVSGAIYLDKFMVLQDAVTAVMPTAAPTSTPPNTPVPTATAINTSTPGPTPVNTATPVPTTTPAPTATPYTLPGAMYAIDPAARYSMVNGQITATYYQMRASDYITVFLLVAILGAQVIALGVMVWRRK